MPGKPPILLSLWSRPSACRGPAGRRYLSSAEKGDRLLCPAPETAASSQHRRGGQRCLSPFSVPLPFISHAPHCHRPSPSVFRRSLRGAGTLACRIGTRADVRSTRGQALLEFAFTIPLLFLLIVIAINFGGWLYSWIEVENAARAAANYAILGGSSAGLPPAATGTGLVNLINAELASLPNTTSSNPTISVCKNNNGTVTALTGTCPSSPPLDPEAPSYVSAIVDISFTYTPLIPTFSFPGLGIGLPGIPATIHRRTVMRMIQ